MIPDDIVRSHRHPTLIIAIPGEVYLHRNGPLNRRRWIISRRNLAREPTVEIVMSKLFSSVQIGAVPLKHRVVMAPLTRSRAGLPDGVPGDLMLDYYTQRASDGGLIISEGTPVSPSARGWLGAPGIYSEAQVAGWKRITDAVHAKGGRIFAQLWHTGRSSHVTVTEGTQPVSASVDAA